MQIRLIKVLKATVINIIVAFIIAIIILESVQLVLGDKIDMAISLANNISIGESENSKKETNFNKTENKLEK